MSSHIHDYYNILGVSKSASPEEIQKVYRRLAKLYHPDINKDKGAEDKFKKITEAYEVLKDPDSRRKYDTFGNAWNNTNHYASPTGWQNIDLNFGDFGQKASSSFSSIFDTFFKKSGSRNSYKTKTNENYKSSVANSEIFVNISPWEAVLGAIILISTSKGNIKLKVPAGTQSGTRMRLKGMGKFDSSLGITTDLYVIFHIVIPINLTGRELELFQILARESRFIPKRQ